MTRKKGSVRANTVLSVLVIDNGNSCGVDERERARFRWWLTPREGGVFSSPFVQDETRLRHTTHQTSTRSASRSHVLLKGRMGGGWDRENVKNQCQILLLIAYSILKSYWTPYEDTEYFFISIHILSVGHCLASALTKTNPQCWLARAGGT